MPTIARLSALEILDSRGRPTIKAACGLATGATGTASVPSGASTGRHEAHELRDHDPARYGGLGVRRAVANVNGETNDALRGRAFVDPAEDGGHDRWAGPQRELDEELVRLDGTPDKSRLGANAILAVSLAFARAVAAERGVPPYQHFIGMRRWRPRSLPRPTINLFSGGKHAGGQVPIQDVLIVPQSAKTIDESLAAAYAVYQAAAKLTARKYGSRALVADEGGLAPPFPDVDTMLADAVESIHDAGLSPGADVALAVDVAATHLSREGRYQLGDEALTATQMIDQIERWVDRYPIISIEDGLAEDDWEHWPMLCERLNGRARVMGDDLLCTNRDRIARAVTSRAANALLLKVNQVGTVSEALAALDMLEKRLWTVTVSARSGETEDDWLADLAVGWSADYIKIGSITRSERLAKYNRLLEIEAETRLPLAGGISST